jgi:DNA-binding Lrp family transcriptional regulator
MKKYENVPYSNGLIDECLKLIKENPRITVNEIAKKLNKSPLTISRLLSFLRKEGILPSLKKVVPHSLTLEKEMYPEEKEEGKEDREIERLSFENEALRKENEKLKSIINQLTSENSFLKTQLKVNETIKKNELELSKELTQLKVKVLEYEIKELEAILNDDDDNKMYNYLSAIKWHKKNELRKLENELSKIST